MLMSSNKKIRISIIVPLYNCEDTVYKAFTKLIQIFKDTKFTAEFIAVIDGKNDSIVKELNRIHSDSIKILHYKQNKGKGFAVKMGMSRAEGEFLGYIDGGDDISPENLLAAFEKAVEENADIVCGNKLHKDSIVKNYTFTRRIFTKGYNLLAKILLGIDYQDTQVGLKIYSKRFIKNVLPRILVKRFAFEVEILTVGKLLGFDKHFDVPVQIEFGDKSTAARMKPILLMILDTLAVFYRLRILKYYSKSDLKKSVSHTKRQIQELILL